MKYVAGLLAAIGFLFSTAVQAQEIEDQYLHVMTLADQADSLKTSGKLEPALAKYKEALRALQTFQRTYPRWNMNMVSFRMNDLTRSIEALSGKPAAAASGPASSGADARVKLIEPGAEPRKAFRFHPKAGDQQNMQLSMKIGLAMKMGDVLDQALKMPGMELTMSTTVKNIAENGDISYELKVVEGTVPEDAEVMPQISEPAKAALESMKGLVANATISSIGLTKTMEFKAPEGADPRTKQMLDETRQKFSELSAPLPGEPIGVGAKWEVKSPLQANGLKIDQSVVYELVSVEEDSLTIKSAITQTASKQKMQIPAMPAMKLDLEKMQGQGAGESKVDLSKVVADGTVNMHSEISASMKAGDQNQSLTIKTDVKVSIQAK